MLLHLPRVLDAEQLASLRDRIARGRFVEGRGTAEGSAAAVKNKQQMDPESEETKSAGAFLLECLGSHPLFRLAAQPRSFSQPPFSRYGPGMSYGTHLDAPVMHRSGLLRMDISTTVFLNGPDEYEGGDLVIETSIGERSFKCAAGDR